MATEIAAINHIPKLSNGLTPLLSKHLGSQDLAKHKATLALELEVLAKKFDRFGWDRDRGTAAQDRLMLDWMDALKDYPLSEVQAACKQAIRRSPNRMPNEAHVIAEIERARAVVVASNPKPPEAKREHKGDPEGAARILKEVGVSLGRAARQKAGKVLDVVTDKPAEAPPSKHWGKSEAPDSPKMRDLQKARDGNALIAQARAAQGAAE